MIKLIIFDLDGVLVSTKDMHYESLNEALSEGYKISLPDHLDRYDGLPTLRKLQMLTEEKGLPELLHQSIMSEKQRHTFSYIRSSVSRNEKLISVMNRLKADGYLIYVASNSIRETVKLLLCYTGLIEYVDAYISNEDVRSSKPHSEMYLKCMADAGVNIDETLIVEDSPRGIEAAQRTKASTFIVESPEQVTYEAIIKKVGQSRQTISKLKLPDLNVLIPMAGHGSRFAQAGYTFPKPLIEVNGKPMIQLVVENLGFEANYVYIVRKEHYDQYNLKSFLSLLTPNCTIIQVDEVTQGAACTTLLAREHINNSNPLIIANSDQFVEWNPSDFYYKMVETKADGGIVTFEATHPKWSYAKINQSGNVMEVAEKDPISNLATAGIYYYRRGSEYVKYAEQMIQKEIRTNNEFYVCPIFNEFIGDSKTIKTFNVSAMFGLGTPEDLEYYLTKHNGNI